LAALYLAGRQQFVRLSGHSSSTTQCVCGVPQGSVLGPLLFTTYVSPVGELIESYGISYHQFADDTQLLVTMNSTDVSSTASTTAPPQSAAWFLLNGLQLNASKSEVVFLGTADQLRSVADVTTIDVAGSSLQVAPQLMFLGVIIDSRLRFDSHARNVARGV